mgnify:CR=1 FL=1
MLNKIRAQLDRIRQSGATYVDCRWYPFEESNALMMWNGNLKQASASRESGVGVRVLYKGAWGFAASSDVNHLSAVFDRGQRPGRRGTREPAGTLGGERRRRSGVHQP